MTLWESITHYEPNFQIFGPEHLRNMLIVVVVIAALILLARRSSDRAKSGILIGVCSLMTASVLFWFVLEMAYDRFFIDSDLPLVFCNFFAVFILIFAFTRNHVIYNILYYVVIVGATQAIISPGLKFNFPHYEAIKFWTVHGGLLFVVLYMIFVYRMLPTIRGVIQAFIFIQVYVLLIMAINWVLGSNYLFLNQKPEVITLLSWLGDWPYYIIFMDLLVIPFFFISYLPVLGLRRLKAID